MSEQHAPPAPDIPLLTGAALLMPATGKSLGGRFPLAIAAALLAHMAVAAPLLLHGIAATGAGGIDRDAISIDVVVVPASALESRVVATTAALATATTMEQDPGREVVTAAVPVTELLEADPPDQVSGHTPIQTTDQARPAITLEPALAQPAPPLLADAKPEPEPERLSPSHATPVPPSASSGGAASVGADAVPTASAAPAVAASGSAERYARSVVETLGKSRPKVTASGRRGTVKVMFAIADDGALKFARVTASSGHDALDAAALTAVQRVSFPAPPAGLSVIQLTYEIPYRFR